MPQKPSKSGRFTQPTANAKALEEVEFEEEAPAGLVSKPSGKYSSRAARRFRWAARKIIKVRKCLIRCRTCRNLALSVTRHTNAVAGVIRCSKLLSVFILSYKLCLIQVSSYLKYLKSNGSFEWNINSMNVRKRGGQSGNWFWADSGSETAIRIDSESTSESTRIGHSDPPY